MLINNNKYKLVVDYKNGFDETELRRKMTDFFNDYDLIVGDWSYGNLRLKGFCNSNNKIFNQINDIKLKEEYLKTHCGVDCKHFIIEKE